MTISNQGSFAAFRFVFQAGGKVQEKPTAARVEVEDPDCQRKSEGDEGRKYREGETNRNAAAAFMPNGAEIAGERSDTKQRGYPGLNECEMPGRCVGSRGMEGEDNRPTTRWL